MNVAQENLKAVDRPLAALAEWRVRRRQTTGFVVYYGVVTLA